MAKYLNEDGVGLMLQNINDHINTKLSNYLPKTTTIPTKTSDLTNNSGFVTSADTIAAANTVKTMKYGTCSTAAGTQVKGVTVSGFNVEVGAQIRIKFSNVNTNASPRLSVNGGTSYPIYYNGSAITSSNFTFDVDKIYVFTFTSINSTNCWVLEGDWDSITSTTVSGWGFTKNTGTITGITMNGASKGTSGVVNLGAVVTDVSNKQDTLVSGTNIKTINGTSILGSGDITIEGGSSSNIINYGVCGTAAATAAKVVTVTGATLTTGTNIRVKFTYANTSPSSLTLNVNSLGAKPMYYNGATVTGANFPFDADKIYTFTYDGSYWRIDGDWLNSVNAVSSNANYPVILGPSASAGASVSSGDKMLYTDSVNSLYYNPSTNTLSSPNIVASGTISGGAYGVCSDAGTTTTKAVTLAGFTLVTGAKISVKFTNSQSTALTTGLSLNVNSTGAKVIYYKGAVIDGNITGVVFEAGSIYDFVYDGTNWILQGEWDNKLGYTTGVYYGICDTVAGTVTKVVAVDGFTAYTEPHKLIIYFKNGTSGNITINVNGLGNKRCFFNGRSNHFPELAPGPHEFHYIDGIYEMTTPIKQKTVYYTGARMITTNIMPHTHYRISHTSGMTKVTISNSYFEYNELYSLEIVTASSGCTITLPNTIKWVNGTAPTWKASKLYQISIMNYCAVAAEFDIPANFEYEDPNLEL